MVTIFLFVLGTVVGSFLNVIAMRWGTGEGFGGRSRCPNCRRELKWFELIPFISFILQRGKCRSCGARISPQYPLVELLTGLIFITVPYLLLPVFCLYVVILIYDAHHKIIPDALVYLAIIFSLGVNLLNLSNFFNLLNLLAGPILFAFFAAIWLLSRGRAMGFGDAKLGLSVGLLLGAAAGFSAIILAFWIGAFSSLIYIFAIKTSFIKSGKGLTMKSEVPFAPFIILGAWLSLIFNLDILHVAVL